MKSFITYFDFLGYKSFILKNSNDYVSRRVNDILTHLEMALGQGKYNKPRPEISKIYPDLGEFRINCLNISDTIILWTNNNLKESFEELLKISYQFNWHEIFSDFPLRGVLIFDEINSFTGSYENIKGGTYTINPIFGKGLVKAHLKAKKLNWAGTVIDNTVIQEIEKFLKPEVFLSKYAIKYKVPYKNYSNDYSTEYVFRLGEGKINKDNFNNCKKSIEDRFRDDNKVMTPDAKTKLKNTIKFLETLKEC